MSQPKSRLTTYIFIALAAGIIAGYFLNLHYVAPENMLLTKLQQRSESVAGAMKASADTTAAGYSVLKSMREDVVKQISTVSAARDAKLEPFSLLSDLFLRLIKMIVAPLVLTTLVAGVAKLGDVRVLGRIGARTMAWFVSASFVSLLLGMVLVNLLKPGVALHLRPPEGAASGVEGAHLSLKNFLYHLVPINIFDALAHNEILQIVVFALLFGVATAALGEKGKKITEAFDTIGHIMLKVTGYIMKLAPLAVFGGMAAVIARQGPGLLKTYSIFIAELYGSLALLWMILFLAGSLFAGKKIFGLWKHIRTPVTIAFSTSTSEAAFPKTMEELQRFGCPEKVVSFVLPLGYSFNLDGSMMYMTFASLFIAQCYGIDLSISTQLTMLLVLMLTSKGIAGVPRASLVVIAGTLAAFNIPEAGLALLLGIDPLLDMGRSATNVVGNSVACVVVSQTETQLK